MKGTQVDNASDGASQPRQLPIGLEGIVELLLVRIEAHLTHPARPEAWVAGVFGEWGSGKSTLLSEIALRYPNTPVDGAEQAVTLRVEFNAWRYEREEHLLVPLLRTIERTLQDYVAAVKAHEIAEAAAAPAHGNPLGIGGATRDKADQAARQAADAAPEITVSRWKARASWLADRAQLVGQCAVALTQMVKFKAGLPFVGEIEVSPYAGLRASQEQIDRHAQKNKDLERVQPPAPAQQTAHSLYYNLFDELKRLTRGDSPDAEHLNFVFLVDDLDRCLPEKAVEMLESIKLFLDVAGCVFVLAVDDEVVERGIAHRYRDYLDLTDRAAESIAHSLRPDRYKDYLNRYTTSRQAPITGAEYLEKIVQLPVRLPRFSRNQATELLRRHAPELFAPSAPVPGIEPSDWLLELFLEAVPPVPRKLIRAADLMVFVRQLAARQHQSGRLHQYTLAQLALLQVFAPQIFRFLTRRDRMESWTRLDARLDDGRRKRGLDLYGASFFEWWADVLEEDRKKARDESVTTPGVTLTQIERYEEPFIAEMRQAVTARSGFDPRKLFLPALRVDLNLRPYFNLLAEDVTVAAATATPSAPVASPPAPSPVLPPGLTTIAAPLVPAAPAAPPRPVAPAAPQPGAGAAAPASVGAPSPPTTLRPAAPRELESFVDLLLSTSEDSWHGALNSEPILQGRVLDRPSFARLREELNKRSFPVSAAWIRIVAPILTDLQVTEVIAASGVVPRLAGSEGAFDVYALGALLESACLRLQRWHEPVGEGQASPSALSPQALGLDAAADLRRREWSYRYRRGLVADAVGDEEPLEIWRGYRPTMSTPASGVREVAPGLLAVSTIDGDVRLWTRAFRGQWTVQARMGVPVPGAWQVAPLDSLHIVGWAASTLCVWRQDAFGRRLTIFQTSFAAEVLGLTVLAHDCFVAHLRTGVRSVWLRGRAPSEWRSASADNMSGIRDVVRLGPRRYAILPMGIPYDVREDGVFAGSSIAMTELQSLISIGEDRLLAVLTDGTLALAPLDGGLMLSSIATAKSGIPLGKLVDVSGRFVLMLNHEGDFEVWSVGHDRLERLGHGSVGRLASATMGSTGLELRAGVCLLRDGRVVEATSTSVVVKAPVSPDAEFAFDEALLLVDPQQPVGTAQGRNLVLGHRAGAVQVVAGADGSLLGSQQVSVLLRQRGAGIVDACVAADGAVVLADGSSAIAILEQGSRSTVSLDGPATLVAASHDAQLFVGPAVYVAGRGSLYELSKGSAGWGQSASWSIPGDPSGLVAASGRVAVWHGPTLTVIDTTAAGSANSQRFDLVDDISSVAPISAAPGSYLVCAGGRLWRVGGAQTQTWGALPGYVTVAAPLEGERALVFTSDGALHIVSGQALLERAFEGAVHGWPSHIRAIGNSRALVYARDDAWYFIDASNTAEPVVERLLMVEDALVTQQVDLSRPLGPAPTISLMLALDTALKSDLDVERREVGAVGYVPIGDAARRLVALARKNGELVEPTARPATIGWEIVPPSRAIALRLSDVG